MSKFLWVLVAKILLTSLVAFLLLAFGSGDGLTGVDCIFCVWLCWVATCGTTPI